MANEIYSLVRTETAGETMTVIFEVVSKETIAVTSQDFDMTVNMPVREARAMYASLLRAGYVRAPSAARKPAPRTHTCGYAYRPQNATYCWFCHCG